jgi:hypothetical protein
MPIISDEFGAEIIEILGLPKETRKVEIIFESRKAIKIKGEFYTEHKYIDKFCAVLKNKLPMIDLEFEEYK